MLSQRRRTGIELALIGSVYRADWDCNQEFYNDKLQEQQSLLPRISYNSLEHQN